MADTKITFRYLNEEDMIAAGVLDAGKCVDTMGEVVSLLQCCAVLCLVAQSCPALCDPMDCSPPGFSVHGIFQARVLE